ncbi:MAG: HlyC/CorC family transporter [Rhodospirillales bacterium]|nr:HlyC/CorC family transporter [Rhodospirillales bacterium]MBO6786117.1 HlyC/CorC family transporter [Rhodospirillales bacterium]
MLEIGLAIFVLLVLSGFFSGSETALTAASKHVMHQLEQSGDKRANLVNEMHEDKERLIGAILLGNNLVNILASALATSLLIQLFGDNGVAFATVVMTMLILIFSEILPKTYAIRNANRMALFVAPIIKPVIVVLAPITLTINAIVRQLLLLLGAGPTAEGDREAAEEELRGAIELHDGDEPTVKQERDMLRSVLELTEVQVEEIMTHRRNVVAIDASLPSEEIVRQVLESPYTRIPLWKDDPENIVGVLHAKALLREVMRLGGDSKDLDIMSISTAPWFIPEQTLLLDQLQAFRNRREHFALVIDEYGSNMGVVTLEDIIEEIVGDIDDEHDVEVTGVAAQADGSYLIDGTVTLRDLNREYEWDLPDEEASTIAGLVLHESRRIPEVGQSFMFHEFRFDIVGRQSNQITRIRVTPPNEDDPENVEDPEN